MRRLHRPQKGLPKRQLTITPHRLSRRINYREWTHVIHGCVLRIHTDSYAPRWSREEFIHHGPRHIGLKNAGASYQRLLNKMFAEQLGRTVEVYIDDMLVKSLKGADHIRHLRQYFDVLNKYNMKLNLAKCTFGVTLGDFLGYIVTQRGIEANPK